jgi:dipeptidyl aminopeptidase/acylaminoacyl peptidase
MTEPTERGDRTDRTVAPYGSWRSMVRVEDVVADVIILGEPWVDGDDVYWLEGRPLEGGRRVLVRAAADGSTADLTPPPINVRTRVHEYGGGSYVVTGGTVVYSNFADGRLYRLDPLAESAVAITPEGPWRYADLRPDPTRRRFFAVREDHGIGDGSAATVANTIVTIPLDGGDPTVLVSGVDFVSSPRLSPDGRQLAWLEWDNPDMPWDATRLRFAPLLADGSLGERALAAGGPDESIVQPEWSPDGVLHLVSDRSGWWNLYRLVEGPRLEPLAPMEAEFADPAWLFDRSSYAFLPDGTILAAARRDGHDRLVHIAPGSLIGEVESPFTEFEGLRGDGTSLVALAGSPSDPWVVVRIDPTTLAVSGVLRRASSIALESTALAIPEPIEFPTTGGRTAHALYYAPINPDFEAPEGERAPLIVLTHGGPTSNTLTTLELARQFMPTRGIGVVDVNYGGSTGYGREYRRRLDGQWGIVDVDDAVAAADFLVARGDVDPDRIAIEGGSAGGYTTLAALAFRDTFTAGMSSFGVADLESLVRETHKFEARYMDRLVGPLPQAVETYRARSPVHAFDRIGCPVLVLQGLEDRVVPPSQADEIVAALKSNGIPYAYLAFEGEGHGFRGATAIRRALEARLAFLGQVFGFEPADELPPLEVPGIDAWRKRKAAQPKRAPVAVGPGPTPAAPADGHDGNGSGPHPSETAPAAPEVTSPESSRTRRSREASPPG